MEPDALRHGFQIELKCAHCNCVSYLIGRDLVTPERQQAQKPRT